jgi:hypothetical protein
MNSRRRRNFYILDAIILIAATAIGMAGYIAVQRYLQREGPAPPGGLDRLPFEVSLRFRLHDFCRGFPCLLHAWGFAVLLLRLRTPRPRLRRMFRAPGAAACLAVFVMLTLRTAELLVTWFVRAVRPLHASTIDWAPSFVDTLTSVGEAAGPGIFALWVILAVNRALILSRDWLETLARAVALGWVVLLLETPVGDFLYAFK